MKHQPVDASLPVTIETNARHTRRAFVKRVLAAGAAASFPNVVAGSNRGDPGSPSPSSSCGDKDADKRQQHAYAIRIQAAAAETQRPFPSHPNNGDETRLANKIGNFTKGLPHNSLGQASPNAYRLYLAALTSGDPADFERIPLGCADGFRLVNPQAGLAYDLEGADSHASFEPPAPAFGSDEENSEIIELYWMTLARDVPFSEYDTNPLTQAAAADLTNLGPAFKGPKVAGQVTTGTLFRDDLPGTLIGPYNSQFRYLPVSFGGYPLDQMMITVLPGQDFMTEYAEWLNIQNGCLANAALQYDPVRRFIRTGRDAAQWVHVDVIYEAYMMAMLILLASLGTDSEGGLIYAPLNPGNPYLASGNQAGFVTFGSAHIASLLTEVATRALKAQWFQKWFVHRRLRPEEYAGCIHNTLTGAASYPIGSSTLQASSALDLIHSQFGSYLLPQAFPEGCPLHPAYGSGHATVAGACVTILKAFFDESFVIPFPVQPSADGISLEPYTGPGAGQMTVGGELNKLASNVAQSRNIAGVHWRTDAVEALKVGEFVALSILRDQRNLYNESFKGFTFTRFDGTKITV